MDGLRASPSVQSIFFRDTGTGFCIQPPAISPDAEPFAKIGTKINADSTVCIIEAMKVMNEIKAELSGEIIELLVENGTAVQYGEPLFRVKIS